MSTELVVKKYISPILTPSRVQKVCAMCNKSYICYKVREQKSKFCSRSCQVAGQVWTQERKDKIGKANSGIRLAITGEKNYNWKGGNWTYIKRKVRERDKDMCQCTDSCNWHIGNKCNFSEKAIMHVDHIKPKKLFPLLALDITNLKTLCPNCHQMKTNEERRQKIFKVTKN